jgi:hypothetical protein
LASDPCDWLLAGAVADGCGVVWTAPCVLGLPAVWALVAAELGAIEGVPGVARVLAAVCEPAPAVAARPFACRTGVGFAWDRLAVAV